MMLMDYYYQPDKAAEVAEWVNYITPVPSAQQVVLHDAKNAEKRADAKYLRRWRTAMRCSRPRRPTPRSRRSDPEGVGGPDLEHRPSSPSTSREPHGAGGAHRPVLAGVRLRSDQPVHRARDILRERGHSVVFAAETSWAGRLAPLGFDRAARRPRRTRPTGDDDEDAGKFWTDFIAETAPEFRKPTHRAARDLHQADLAGAHRRRAVLRAAAARDHRRGPSRCHGRGQRGAASRHW